MDSKIMWIRPAQGENSVSFDAGNSQDKTGYSCMMATLVKSWRNSWSALTSSEFPIGLVSLADATGTHANFVLCKR